MASMFTYGQCMPPGRPRKTAVPGISWGMWLVNRVLFIAFKGSTGGAPANGEVGSNLYDMADGSFLRPRSFKLVPAHWMAQRLADACLKTPDTRSTSAFG